VIHSRRRQSGQAALETALVVMIFFILIIGFVGVGVLVEAKTETQAAVRLATISALQAPLGDGFQSQEYAMNTFEQTMKQQKWVTATWAPNACSGPYLTGGRNKPNSPHWLQCTATNVTVDFSEIGPLSMLWPGTLSLGNITVVVYPSSYRSCQNGVRCQ
jgi:Flp pilus assembly protein TadG